LSFLLDGLHEDLNKIINKPILSQIESDGTNEEFAAKKSWENHCKRNDSMINDLMGGQYKS